MGLRGLRRVRDDVFGWLQRLSLRYHDGTEAGDIIFRASAFASILALAVVVIILPWSIFMLPAYCG